MKAIGMTPKLKEIVDRRSRGECDSCPRHCEHCGRHLPEGSPFSRHHRIPRQMGGSRELTINGAANIICLCGSATSPGGCHLRAEAYRDWARSCGLLLYGSQEPSEVPFWRVGSWARIDYDGRVEYLSDYDIAMHERFGQSRPEWKKARLMQGISAHPFTPDVDSKNWQGRYISCAVCMLPAENDVHLLPDRPEDDVTERILGEASDGD